MIAFTSFLIASALVFTEGDAQLAYDSATNLVAKCTPRDAGTGGGCAAAYWILDTVSMCGVDVRRDQFRADAMVGGKVRTRTFTNLYATNCHSNDAPWVIFVSHYDTKPGVKCPGANDGASTTGLLIALAAAVESRGYDGTANVAFLWVDGEECISNYAENDGFWGSKRAAAELKRREVKVRAVVCLDMLGDRNLEISIPYNVDERLSRLALIAANRVGIKVLRMRDSVKDDHVAFMEYGWPAINLIDFEYGPTKGSNSWWHTPEDSVDKISVDSLYQSGRLAAELLNILAK